MYIIVLVVAMMMKTYLIIYYNFDMLSHVSNNNKLPPHSLSLSLSLRFASH